ncbi:TetR/AcrR family transcriptional regulator [Comamonas sp. JC664]|uniref:TetR/AcrR family transcriptional regulator n=1 Tax=Comamonas sp. JC664 TaxID=2801917 RepID=UPI00174C6AED|nr:TetR/AcrR family transcriptional regulator [Comamonas sp. JC664]MBL0698660.1 TetR family transcriptional regulator [Comamonas sp. JC664]GHG78395.1 TetR family transcriptional regulator [Comamonas sp. KCTC 72670]
MRKKTDGRRRSGARKQPSQVRSRALVDALIQTTARVLLRDGWQAMTTNRIAQDAGVSVGSLYQYFPNKEALLLALVERIADEMTARLIEVGTALGDATVDEGITTFVRAALDLSRRDAALYRAVLVELPRQGTLELFARVNRRLADALADWLVVRRDELDVADPSLTAHILVTSIDALTDHALLFHPELLDSPRFERELRALMARYLGVRRPAEGPPRREQPRRRKRTA